LEGDPRFRFSSLKKPIIVGIDPGTTTALASLDLNGNILSLQSRKNLKRSDIISLIIEQGNPIIVASDIYPVPHNVEKIAASFNCKLLHPEENYSRKAKWSYMKTNFSDSYRNKKLYKNRHERDALLAAFFGWNSIKSLVQRIAQRLEQEDMMEYHNQVASRVILEGKSITSAIESDFSRYLF
jgi:uncharacterized protein